MLAVVWLREPDEERPANRDGLLCGGLLCDRFFSVVGVNGLNRWKGFPQELHC